jgi:hypothetical protein
MELALGIISLAVYDRIEREVIKRRKKRQKLPNNGA